MSVDEADLIAGMTPTGRRLATPAAELVEAQDARGLKHLVWRAQDVHRSHPALKADLQIGWMESPEVTGLARLVHHDPDAGTFAYATGTCFTVAEIVRIYAEEETGAGVKAGLELCYLVAEALSEASEAAFDLGVFSHGNLNPWTIVVKPDGQPLVLCYGLPQVEMKVWQEDPRAVPREDSFRYAPPERVEGHDEDIASDLFALALIGLEFMVGRPVYDGLLDDIRQQAARGEGMRRLYQWREKLPANVREVLGRALKPDPDTRYRRGLDFVYAVHDLLGSIDVEGPSLVEVMAKVRAVTKRGKGPIIGGKTGMLSAEELKELAADLDEIDDKPLPPPRAPRPAPEPEEAEEDDDSPAPRWQRRKGAEPEPPADPKAKARDRLKRRLRRSSGTAPGADPTPEEGSARDRLRRRLRGSKGEEKDEAPRRRLRRGGDDAPDRPRRRREVEASAASQSIDLGDPLGFDEDAEHGSLSLVAARNTEQEDILHDPTYSSTVVNRVYSRKEPMVITGTEEGHLIGSHSAVMYNLRSIMAAPLICRNRLLGVVYLDNNLDKKLRTNEDVQFLVAMANQIAVQIDSSRAARLEVERTAMAKDLALTAAVQELFLPKDSVISRQGLSVAGICRAADQAGGDWWWLDEREDSEVNVFLGDVAGHGAGSAMVTAAMAALCRHVQRSSADQVQQNLQDMHEVLYDLCSGYYPMALLVVSGNDRNSTIRWWGGGTPQPIIMREDSVMPLMGTGSTIGGATFNIEERQLQLAPGERMLLYTDGIIEQTTRKGRSFGFRRLLRLFDETREMSLQEAIDFILGRFDDSRGDIAQEDDVTLVIVERQG